MKESKKAILKLLKKKCHNKDEKFESLVLNLALQKIDSDSFEFDGEGVYSADGKRFIYCMSQSESFSIQEGTAVIGEMAFRGKKHLKNIIIPSTTSVIECDAFYDCDELETVYLPASVEKVSGYSFAECDKLKRVTFANVPEKLSRHAFDDCDQLREIFIPEGSSSFFCKSLHYDESESEYIIQEVKKDMKKEMKKNKKENAEADMTNGAKKKTNGRKEAKKEKDIRKGNISTPKKTENETTDTKQND